MDKITLEAARINAGYKLADVAALLGRSIGTISAWENGHAEPKVGDAKRMAELYGVDVEIIVFGKGANA